MKDKNAGMNTGINTGINIGNKGKQNQNEKEAARQFGGATVPTGYVAPGPADQETATELGVKELNKNKFGGGQKNK